MLEFFRKCKNEYKAESENKNCCSLKIFKNNSVRKPAELPSLKS